MATTEKANHWLPVVVEALEAAGFIVQSQRRLPNNYGDQIVLKMGQVVDVYDSGMLVCNGPNRKVVIDACKQLWPQKSGSSFCVIDPKGGYEDDQG